MKIVYLLLFILLALVGLGFFWPLCACIHEPAIDLNTVSIHTVQYGTMPLHTKGQGMVGRIENALYMERGTLSKENADVPVFRLDPDKKSATRVTVRFGAIASEMIEIKSGLREGDKVIVTDMDRWIENERIRIE